jgi:hypothetical protein
MHALVGRGASCPLARWAMGLVVGLVVIRLGSVIIIIIRR